MCRKGKELSVRDRYFIEKSLKRRMSVKDIANVLGVSTQCIYYEIKKGIIVQKDTHLRDVKVYKADYAQMKTDRALLKRGRKQKYSSDDELIKNISELIKQKYSPYAVIEILNCNNDICERTIYHYVRRNVLPDVTYLDMPYMKKKKTKRDTVRKLVVPKEYSIETRDKDIYKRDTFGNWEMDTVYSDRDSKTALLVLTERRYRLELTKRISSRSANEVMHALKKIEKEIGLNTFREIFRTITSDNGVEFKHYKEIETSSFSNKPRTKLYYAHPYTSCERGSNENQNKMIRRWIPKGDDIGRYNIREISSYTKWMNMYPRKLFKGESAIVRCIRELSLVNYEQKTLEKLCKICDCDYAEVTKIIQESK